MNGRSTSIASKDSWLARGSSCVRWTKALPNGWRRFAVGMDAALPGELPGGCCVNCCGGVLWTSRYGSWKKSGLQKPQPLRRHAARGQGACRLLGLAGIGANGAWLLVHELFAWRQFANRKQVGAMVGMTPTPYDSGDSTREQGISKAGNRRLRRLLVELAWCWLRWQPGSVLSQWYRRRFAQGPSRLRKIGVVAVARKLLIALWRYVEQGVVPPGAELVDWKAKLNGRRRAAQQELCVA